MGGWMKSRIQFLAGAVVALTIVACADSTATSPAIVAKDALLAPNSNGFPQGPHDYRLNLIGVPKDKDATMDNNNGRRIFVRLNGTASKTPKGGGDDQNH